MAITTLSGLRDGLKQPFPVHKTSATAEANGFLVSTFGISGVPAAAATPSPGLNGEALTSYAGQLPWINPVSGNGYLASLNGLATPSQAARVGYVILCDRLWHNSGITPTTTTEQAITSPTWPARDRNAATSGDGVFVGLEVSSNMGASGVVTNTTLNYTNSAGTSGRTGTITTIPTTLTARSFVMFHLQAGDVGVRSVQGLTLGTSFVSGTMHLVAFRPVCLYSPVTLNKNTAVDALTLGMPRIYDDSVLFMITATDSTVTENLFANLQAAHG
jgi:hypothetical protein